MMRYLVATAAVLVGLLFGSCDFDDCDQLRGKQRERCYFVEGNPPGPESSTNYPN